MTPRLLTTRTVVLADAVLTGATGLLMLAGAPLLDGWLHLPTGLLAGAGAFLLAYIAVLVAIARRTQIDSATIGVIVAVNLAWAAGCLLLLAGASIDPNALGIGFILLQVVVVVIFAVALVTTHRRDDRMSSFATR